MHRRSKLPCLPHGHHHFLLSGILLCLIGVCLLLYPWVSNYLYERQAKTEITAYTELSESMEEDQVEAIIQAAREYNEALAKDQTRYVDPFNTSEFDPSYTEAYWDLMALSDSGVLGYIEIPCISVYLPVFHGTDSDTLLAGIGHMQGSSLPVGGEGTHAVLTGHSGLTGAKMFTDLNQLEEGDYFYFHFLDQTLAYQITAVTAILPNVVDDLRIREGEDLMTLVTCTPYGVNSHRLLVTGTRVEYTEELYEEAQEEKKSVTDSTWMKSYTRAVLIGIAISLFIFILVCISIACFEKAGGKEKRKKKTLTEGKKEKMPTEKEVGGEEKGKRRQKRKSAERESEKTPTEKKGKKKRKRRQKRRSAERERRANAGRKENRRERKEK